MDKGNMSSRELGKHNNAKASSTEQSSKSQEQSGYGEYALNNKHVKIDLSRMAGNADTGLSNEVKNQNQGHNAKKESLGPNTDR